jgi:urocanate hydratase
MPAAEENSANCKAEHEMEAVYSLYLVLARFMDCDGLGGKLLLAGEADPVTLRLVRAANIAGAATLCASADAGMLRRAMREGAVDFVVNSLDEALRILKNEIRKQKPVAVGISIAPQTIVHQMLERGVQPDLLPPELPGEPDLQGFLAGGARRVEMHWQPGGSNFNVIPIPPDWTRPVAAFDALLLECVPPDDFVNRRWVRVAPSYLPSEARRWRSMACDVGTKLQLMARIGDATERMDDGKKE